MPLLYDVFFLLDNPSLSLDCDTKEELAKFYLRGKNIEFDESWKKDFDYMSLFVNLRWAGISSKWTNLTNDKKYTTLRLMSLKKSEKTIDKMLTYTSNIEYSNLQKLKNCLKELY